MGLKISMRLMAGAEGRKSSITGEVDVLALRQFQSSHRSPAKGFKPVPDGFADDMAFDRTALPKGEQA